MLVLHIDRCNSADGSEMNALFGANEYISYHRLSALSPLEMIVILQDCAHCAMLRMDGGARRRLLFGRTEN